MSATKQEIAAQLATIWKSVLGKEIGPEDDFFAVGGDSLGAIRMVMEVQRAFEVDLEVESFFEAPCIDRLATMLAEKRA